MARAISWPSMTSKSSTEAHEMGSKPACHHGWRSVIDPGGFEQQASIRARSQPWGRKPSIIEPAKVVSRFMAVPRGESPIPMRGPHPNTSRPGSQPGGPIRWVFLDVGNVLLDEDPLT